jgi:hypothetical protein
VHHDEAERRWYGWQIIATDGVVLLSASLAASGSSWEGWGDLAAILYLSGGPLVHFAHGDVGMGFGSLGLRVVAPLGGVLMGALVGGTKRNDNGCYMQCPSPAVTDAVVGFALGMLAASIIDVAVLAYDAQPAASPTASTFRLQLAPVATFPRDSTGHVAPAFALAGAF